LELGRVGLSSLQWTRILTADHALALPYNSLVFSISHYEQEERLSVYVKPFEDQFESERKIRRKERERNDFTLA